MKFSNNKIEKATFILTLGCNSHCNFCPEITRREKLGDCNMSFPQVLKRMSSLLADGYTEIILSGGEPTTHPDFEKIVATAQKLGFAHIGVISNGRKFADKQYVEKLIDLGLKYFNISIHAHNQRIADQVYSVADTWPKTVLGIKNLSNYDNIFLSTNVVVNSLNYKYLLQLNQLLVDLGVKRINYRVCKQNDIKDFYFVPPLDKVAALFSLIEKINRNKVEMTLAEFPLCVFAKNAKLLNLCEEIKNNRSLDMTIISRSNENFMRDEYRQNCQECKLNLICKGFDEQYFNKYKKVS